MWRNKPDDWSRSKFRLRTIAGSLAVFLVLWTGTVSGEVQSRNRASLSEGFMDPFDYDPRGRRDPFVQPIAEKPLEPMGIHGPVLPLQRFSLSDLVLTGIIWNVNKPRAMIKDPDGKVHVVGPYAKLGQSNGYIAVIREGEIVVVETIEQDGRLQSYTRVVKITR